ncbi:hypothetical protein AVEN_248198-1 [Araneus ventricosus]|uniref:Uncharacterized protein n=1 Tax=Araneus ventricosus TaxID=182803 RepID=A0A4Y2VWH8_ARAVE|nr:hypothetical protein AVEN_248198-1 [Araneus ventricosus]
MATKRFVRSAIDWAAFTERVPPSEKIKFQAFKARVDGYTKKNKNLEETDEPSAKRAFLSNTSNEELKVPSGSGDTEQLKKNATPEQAKILLANIHDTIKEQVYFAVYFGNDPFYIGKVTKVIDEQNVKMKFLEKGAGNFHWPKRNKLEIINVKYIFYGPVILIVSNPFDVDNAAINIAYKCYK